MGNRTEANFGSTIMLLLTIVFYALIWSVLVYLFWNVMIVDILEVSGNRLSFIWECVIVGLILGILSRFVTR